ncbi:hypothetical protein EJB05_32826 [Eragrostis curvula]|uniref:Coiled-coil SMC6 And NSE5 INteracting (CANIN) domain-containing protein n=1 Tax=Eragrostis curvula TaxID=38414 RepID=A0A5J9UH44_9POAL|nr:hypothetical protein EJB05_32826 [Eragrostis curvula]
MVMDEPLDFEKEGEEEDPLLAAPRPAKRKKVIGLDDLLLDYYETNKDERKRNKAENSKHGSRGDNSDNLDEMFRANSEKEIKICKIVESLEEEAKKVDAREDVPLWGKKIFGCQKRPSILSDTCVENCQLLKSFSADEHLGFDLDIDKGEGFLEGMLMDGWLLKLVHLSGSVEDSVASWTLTKMLYSSNKKLQVSATDFWESVLSLDEGDKVLVKLGYLPTFSVLKRAILSYGYLFDAPGTKASTSASSAADSLEDDGPPENIIAWVRVVSACCKFRKVRSIFSPSEAEHLLVIVISLFLDRGLEGLLLVLGDCLNSLILYFNVSEWENSCVRAAESVAQRVSLDLNCLRIVDCITGTNDRSKFLRSQLALQLLKISFGLKVANVERILKLVTTINVKEKECDLFKLYVYLVLMDKLLFSTDAFRDKTMVVHSWRNYLRNCSTQIGCSDWRFYAPKVRNKASYLLQGVILKR